MSDDEDNDKYFNTIYNRAQSQRKTVTRLGFIAIIIIFLVGFGVLAFLIWYLFLRKQSSSTNSSSGSGSNNSGNNNTPTGCTQDSQCSTGQFCINNSCKTAQCKTAANCKPFMTCNSSNNCATEGGETCANNNDCSAGYGCQQDITMCKGLIGTGCTADSECLTPYVCSNGLCALNTCSSNSNCPNGGVDTICDNATCGEVYGKFCAETPQCAQSVQPPLQGPLLGDLECGGTADGGPQSKCLYKNGTIGCINDSQCAQGNCKFGICF